MATELVTINFNRHFPVFTLKSSVLLPQAVMPLILFEPRYLAMINDVLDSSGMIAMALEMGESVEEFAAPLRPYVCIGHVRDYSQLEDGRYLVLLQGLCRARIVHEVASEPYRMVKLSPNEQVEVDEDNLTSYRQRIEELMLFQSNRLSDSGADLPLSDLQVSTQVIVDAAIALLCKEMPQQYRMLAQPDVRMRAEWLIHKMEAIAGERRDEGAHN